MKRILIFANFCAQTSDFCCLSGYRNVILHQLSTCKIPYKLVTLFDTFTNVLFFRKQDISSTFINKVKSICNNGI